MGMLRVITKILLFMTMWLVMGRAGNAYMLNFDLKHPWSGDETSYGKDPSWQEDSLAFEGTEAFSC